MDLNFCGFCGPSANSLIRKYFKQVLQNRTKRMPNSFPCSVIAFVLDRKDQLDVFWVLSGQPHQFVPSIRKNEIRKLLRRFAIHESLVLWKFKHIRHHNKPQTFDMVLVDNCMQMPFIQSLCSILWKFHANISISFLFCDRGCLQVTAG